MLGDTFKFKIVKKEKEKENRYIYYNVGSLQILNFCIELS